MYRFAIVGCGRIASRHAENIIKAGKLEAVCDIVPEKAKTFADKYNARPYTSLDELLNQEKNVDIVSICSPNGFHAEHSIKSLQGGKHVLCEKPMCITGAAAWQMLETEKYSGKKLFVVKSGRHNPIIKKLKDYLLDGKLGQVYSFELSCIWNRNKEYYTDWRGKKFPDGGTLYTQFSHYLDVLIWLFGDVKEVKAFANNFAHKEEVEFEDTGAGVLLMKNGILGSLNWSVNSFKKNAEIRLLVVAEKATIMIDGEYLQKLGFMLTDADITFPAHESTPNNYAGYQGSMSHHDQIYGQLISDIDNNLRSNSMDGVKTVELIEKIYKSL